LISLLLTKFVIVYPDEMPKQVEPNTDGKNGTTPTLEAVAGVAVLLLR
jgi:hypothetical protein